MISRIFAMEISSIFIFLLNNNFCCLFKWIVCFSRDHQEEFCKWRCERTTETDRHLKCFKEEFFKKWLLSDGFLGWIYRNDFNSLIYFKGSLYFTSEQANGLSSPFGGLSNIWSSYYVGGVIKMRRVCNGKICKMTLD